MQLEARMTCQPALDGRMLMGGVIIQNDVDVLAQRNFAVEGRKLIDLPGYVFRVFVTSRSDSALEIWRDYNGRAAVECRIDELKKRAGGRSLLPAFLRI